MFLYRATVHRGLLFVGSFDGLQCRSLVAEDDARLHLREIARDRTGSHERVFDGAMRDEKRTKML